MTFKKGQLKYFTAKNDIYIMKPYTLIFISFVCLFTSCATYQTFKIDVLKPAKYSMPPEIRSVVLIDESMPYRDSMVNKVEVENEVLYVDTIWNDNFGKQTINSLYKELVQRNFYDTVYVYEPSISNPQSKPKMSWETINAICNQYNAEAILVLNSYYYKSRIKVEKQFDENLFGTMDVNGGILWSAYDIINHQRLYSDLQVDTISWQVSDVSLSGVAQQLPGFRDGYVSLASYLGSAAANHTAPRWMSVNRGLYNSGNPQFMQAAEYVRAKKYGEAIKLWKFLYDKSQDKFKARAAFNLAVISEIMGDFVSAQYWIEESNNFYIHQLKASRYDTERKRTLLYSIELNSRVQSLNKLKEQIGGN